MQNYRGILKISYISIITEKIIEKSYKKVIEILPRNLECSRC